MLLHLSHEREDHYDWLLERQINSLIDHAEDILDYEEARSFELEAEPRGTDICPACFSGHVDETWFWREGDPHRFTCNECGARWQTVVVML